MRISPKQFLQGLRYAAPILLLALASCGGGGGGGSTTTTTTTPTATVPTAPTGVTATSAGCASVNLAWTAVSGATGYKVYRGATVSTANLLTTTPITTTSYSDAGLSQNTPYSYQVTAVNSAGEGQPGTANATSGTCNYVGGSLQGNALSLSTAVSTLAGTAGNLGYIDSTTPASAQFSSPASVTTDGTYLYVADKGNNAIRKIVIATGAVSTLAGAGPTSPGVADGIGTAAQFSGPQGITTDGTNLYVADTQNGSIRKIVISTGLVSTLTPLGTFSVPAAITYDGTNLYVADTGNSTIKMANKTTGVVSGSFISNLYFPQGITTDGTNLYVTSASNIYKIPTATGTATSIISGLTSPQGITTDGTNLYVANTGNHTILKTPIASPSSNPVAGTSTAGSTDGTGSTAQFNYPGGITTDGTNLYITDTGNQTIRKIQ